MLGLGFVKNNKGRIFTERMDLLFLLPRLQVQPCMAGDLDLRENDRNGCAIACQDHEQPIVVMPGTICGCLSLTKRKGS